MNHIAIRGAESPAITGRFQTNSKAVVDIPRIPQTRRCVVHISVDPLCWTVQKYT
jgi:hypothetical protein